MTARAVVVTEGAVAVTDADVVHDRRCGRPDTDFTPLDAACQGLDAYVLEQGWVVVKVFPLGRGGAPPIHAPHVEDVASTLPHPIVV
jgi:hypothetical protein